MWLESWGRDERGLHLKGWISTEKGRLSFDMKEGNLFLKFVSKQKVFSKDTPSWKGRLMPS